MQDVGAVFHGFCPSVVVEKVCSDEVDAIDVIGAGGRQDLGDGRCTRGVSDGGADTVGLGKELKDAMESDEPRPAGDEH